MGARKFRLTPVLALLLALCAAPAAAGCGPQQQPRQGKQGAEERRPGAQTPAATPAPPATHAPGGEGEKPVTTDGGLKTLAAGGYSQVGEAFVAVAREEQTYKELRRLVPDLPELGAEHFRANAVVAAFLGRRRSGGYSVEIARDAEGALRVSEKSPPKDAMVTMALTAAYSVVSVAAPDAEAVRLRLGETWQQRVRPYKVVLGEFTMMGGFAGVRERFDVRGTLGLLRHKNLATFVFDLKGEDARGARALADAATGIVNSDKAALSVDPGSFVLPPRHRLNVEAKLGPGENKLWLTLEGLQTKVADGFGGRGTLEAEATAAPPPVSADDDGDGPM